MYVLITNLAVFNLLRLPQMVIVLQSWFVTLIQSEYIILNIKNVQMIWSMAYCKHL